MKAAVNLFLLLVAFALAGFIAVLYLGLYNVAATEPHSRFFKHTFEVLFERSVERRAEAVRVPSGFAGMELRSGFEHYDHLCVGCHGAPGVEPVKIVKGMNPEPPDLARENDEWTPAQLYWIIEHGLKLTGMPGFDHMTTAEERWQITAFVNALPNLTAAEYQALKAAAASGQGTEHEEHHP